MAFCSPGRLPVSGWPMLALETEGIEFFNVAPDRVRIEVSVHNPQSRPSEPTTLCLRAARLGAFVPWRPLITLEVPRVEPGRTAVVATEVPLASVRRVPPFPDSLCTAGGEGLRLLIQRRLLHRLQHGRTEWRGGWSLPPDPFGLLGRHGLHWGGNIEARIGGNMAERHLARALRVHPGRTNLVLFLVGLNPDSYSFRVHEAGTRWQPELFSFGERLSPLAGEEERPTWYHVWGMAPVLLTFQPPADASCGELSVTVGERSSGQEALVEFVFDSEAQGPGCFAA